MLRAVRFAAKLGFEIDEPVINSIDHHSHLLTNVPAARLFDEFLKLFQAGNAERTFDLLRDHGLFKEMFPATDHELACDENFMRFTRRSPEHRSSRSGGQVGHADVPARCVSLDANQKAGGNAALRGENVGIPVAGSRII